MKQQVVTLLLGEVNRGVRGAVFQPPLGKGAPVYSGKLIYLEFRHMK